MLLNLTRCLGIRGLGIRARRWGLLGVSLAGFLGLCCASGAAFADESDLLPFFAKPYPFRYAYTTRPPRPCWEFRDVETFFGPRRERVWVCDDVVSARY